MTQIEQAIARAVEAYDETMDFLVHAPLTDEETRHWTEYIVGRIKEAGYRWNSSQSIIPVHATLYDRDRGVLFRNSEINVRRVPALRKWCEENGLKCIAYYNGDYEIIIPQMLDSIAEQGYKIISGKSGDKMVKM